MNLSQLCHYSKNLWNEANYRVRQDFIFKGKWKKNKEKFPGEPRLPGYKEKDGGFMLVFTI